MFFGFLFLLSSIFRGILLFVFVFLVVFFWFLRFVDVYVVLWLFLWREMRRWVLVFESFVSFLERFFTIIFSETRLAIISTTEQESRGRGRAYLDISYNNSFTFLVEVVSTCSLTIEASWRGWGGAFACLWSSHKEKSPPLLGGSFACVVRIEPVEALSVKGWWSVLWVGEVVLSSVLCCIEDEWGTDYCNFVNNRTSNATKIVIWAQMEKS